MNRCEHGVGHDDVLDSGAFGFTNDHEAFGCGGVSGFEHQPVLRGQRDDLFDLGQQGSILRHRHEGAILFGEPNLVLGIEGGQPDHAAELALDEHHAFDGRGVYAAHGAIQVDAAEQGDAGDYFGYDICERRRGFVVALEDHGAHAALFGEAGQVDGVDGTGHGVRVGMHVNIDDAVELRVQGCCEQCGRRQLHR